MIASIYRLTLIINKIPLQNVDGGVLPIIELLLKGFKLFSAHIILAFYYAYDVMRKVVSV